MKYEYKVFREQFAVGPDADFDKVAVDYLNKLGEEGWHIFEVDWHTKRVKMEDTTELAIVGDDSEPLRMEMSFYAMGARRMV